MSPKAAQAEANAVFKKSPISASLLTLFHEGRIFITNQFKQHNLKKLEP